MGSRALRSPLVSLGPCLPRAAPRWWLWVAGHKGRSVPQTFQAAQWRLGLKNNSMALLNFVRSELQKTLSPQAFPLKHFLDWLLGIHFLEDLEQNSLGHV